MAFDVSGLSDYVKQNMDELVGAVVLNARTMEVVGMQPGIKGSATLDRMETDAQLQSDAACGFNSLGTTVFTQRIITVAPIKVQEDLCIKTLNKKWIAYKLAAGSKDDAIPFEEFYTSQKTKKINHANDIALWQGDTASGNAQLNKYDGFLKIIDGATGVITGNTGGKTSITAANVREVIEVDMCENIPDALLLSENLYLVCGFDTFKKYTKALRDANLYHMTAENTQSMSMPVYGFENVVLFALPGLTGTDRLIAYQKENLVVGTDLEGEEEQYDMWYSRDDDVVKFSAKWKLGTQIQIPEQIVEFTLSA